MRLISKLTTAALVLTPAAALADGKLEAGFTVGGHVFSSSGELGVPDQDGGASPQSSALLVGHLGYAFTPQLVGELEALLIPTVDDDESRGAVVYGARLHVRYEPFGDTLAGGKLHPFLLAGYGFMAVRTDSMQLANDADQSYDWGLGAHYALNDSMALRFDARHVIVPDRSKDGATSNFELAAGLTWSFGGGRSSSSSIASAPSTVTPSTSDPAIAAAPSAAAVPSTAPPTAASASAPPSPAIAAAPAAAPSPTSKAPAASKAPAPAVTTGPAPASAAKPAPTAAEQDPDGDGIFGAKDGCPLEAEDKDGFRDDDGCPEPDNDLDGIGDSIDRCATDAETINGYADGDGCPDPYHPDLPAVAFAKGSSNFTAESAALLDKAFQTLQSHPVFRVELGGHSSSDESNRTLSLRRAEAVKDYLIRRGISAERLRVLGYRGGQPLATDKSSAGRAKNRRVELKLLPLAPAAK